jgi:hypothetical protein
MAFQINVSGVFQEDLLCSKHIYLITAFSLVNSRYLERKKMDEEERSRMLLEPILNNLAPMTRCIVLLEHPIVVGVHEVHKGLQMATKQCNAAVTSQ